MNDFVFTEQGFDDYLYWQAQDRRILKRINILLKDIERSGNAGMGKPEALKNQYSGFWSRRIDERNRLVYRINDGRIEIIQCRGHYDDR